MISGMFRTSILIALMSVVTAASAENLTQQWNFRVSLDDKPIGTHQFFLEHEGGLKRLSSEADFEYRLLFVKLFDYEHENTETWKGDCLAGIESRTDSNGEPYSVSGRLVGDIFRVEGSQGTAELPPCVMTFAYWDHDFLSQDRALNTQNGEYVDIEVTGPEDVELEVRGSNQPALRYDLQAGDMNLQLWYSLEREWLALESAARGGRVLRYELL